MGHGAARTLLHTTKWQLVCPLWRTIQHLLKLSICIPSPRTYTQQKWVLMSVPPKDRHQNVQSTFVLNNPKPETVHMASRLKSASTNCGVRNRGLLCGREKEGTPAAPVTWTTLTDMMLKDKKPGSNDYTQCDFILLSSRTDKTSSWW